MNVYCVPLADGLALVLHGAYTMSATIVHCNRKHAMAEHSILLTRVSRCTDNGAEVAAAAEAKVEKKKKKKAADDSLFAALAEDEPAPAPKPAAAAEPAGDRHALV